MKIIVGLGNIGEKYAKSRHNAGFLALDHFEKHQGGQNIEIKWTIDEKHKAKIAKLKYNNLDIMLVKPLTMMNLSGLAVSSILRFYKEEMQNLIVIYDDIDLPLGDIRIRDKGSAGTHNGMKSIIQELGSENFTRIRIGIENRTAEQKGKFDLANYVLAGFTKSEEKLFKESLEKTLRELENLLTL
ncbi:aminoacyl-tRNA hydrolase [Candidatus Peregrinibacteria bacterium]|nr:aminoacyl-tRNA hydrolase [Candidatus Peregrinibacteria bacterium]